MKVKFLREKYPRFIYEKYFYKISGNNLEIFFDFLIEPKIKFKPKIIIENINKKQIEEVGPVPQQAGYGVKDRVLDNLIFHLGLIELSSYWKATCSPEIIIKAGFLNSEQIKWCKDLIIKGMGQFFYENRIDWRKPNFLKIKTTQNPNVTMSGNVTLGMRLKYRYLIPVGGGKDSIVTLEFLKKQGKTINCFLVNPTIAAQKVAKVAGIKNPIIVKRRIDPVLLKLNQRGYLNGHTPFTAVLSFLSVFCAVLFDYKNIVFSNEESANEGNVKYLGKIINHQWSKSSEFEKKFKNYCQKYLAESINYFSLLRPYTELEISKMFIKYPQYFSVFSSCNAGQKTGQRWCGECPKCLFVYAVLYPFLEKKELLKIFGKDLFDPSTSSRPEGRGSPLEEAAGQEKLLLIMKSLIGWGRPKPFECVGTKKESKLAFSLSLKKAQQTGKIPFLLTKIKN